MLWEREDRETTSSEHANAQVLCHIHKVLHDETHYFFLLQPHGELSIFYLSVR